MAKHLVAFFAGIVVHELIHAISWMVFGRQPRSAISFGIEKKTLTPYAHCKAQLPVDRYRWGAFMPGLLLGILPALAAALTGSVWLLLFGLVFTLTAGGDFLILWLIRSVEDFGKRREGIMEIAMYVFIEIFCYFFASIVHELGHIFVGLINGWKFCWLVIGPIGIKVNQSGRLQLYLEKQVALWGGAGCTIPRYAKEENINVWSKVLIGGPIASIIIGTTFLPAGIITENMVLLLLGAMPLGMGIVSILPIPWKTGIFYTDGGRWSRFNHGGLKAEEEIALFKLAENEATGYDFSKIDLNSIEPLIRSEEAGIRYYGYYNLLRYYKTISDTEKMQSTIEKMEEIKSKVPAVIVNNCKTE